MQWVDQLLGVLNASFAVPGWVAVAAAVAGVVFVVLLFARSEPNDHPVTILVLLGMLAGGLAVGGAVVRAITGTAAGGQAQALEQRAATLDSAAAQTPALGCLTADTSLAVACEAVLFERPDSVSAARGLVRERIALVEDATDILRKADVPGLSARVMTWRRPLELDPFGFTAAVLAEEFGCTPSFCPPAVVLGDSTRVVANMTEGRYQSLVAKYAPIWERNARNRGTLNPAPPVRTGPFGFAVVPHDNGTGGSGTPQDRTPQERPPVANLPVEDAPAPPAPAATPASPTPLPPSRPSRPAAAPAAAPPAARPATPPRPRPQAAPAAPAPDAVEPAGDE
ncbi:conserved hypothetical protein [Xanthobacter versatilis]|uniref:Uncharacterized protein n=1 Tax=Xanthobacter autotrophicus (strain ATCC BAA-1158 / Py2) TaxID=78245 RepID=A7INT2_XANP2|nr:conserved hypothetical protein [Xanthobacter autotrophicus Py2]